MKTRTFMLALPVAMLALCCNLSVADTELPDARSLVDAHIEASGGMEALERQLDSTTQGRFVMPAASMEGTMTMYSRTPTERAMMIELEGIGTIHSGYKDGQAWSVDPFMGPRLITDVELDMQIESNEIGALIRSEEYVESMQTVGTAEYDGKPCFKVNVVWKSGRESIDCYSGDTGLMIAQEATVESPMGSMQMVTVFTDYKPFESNGVEITLPAVTNVMSMGQQQQLIIDSVELGAPADEHFELPPAIITLMESDADAAE
ncbi:MAG: hypothetical protein AAF446_06200 [Pseudomonadota bacterium]